MTSLYHPLFAAQASSWRKEAARAAEGWSWVVLCQGTGSSGELKSEIMAEANRNFKQL